MDSLEKFKDLDRQDMLFLESYIIYREIYKEAKKQKTKISDNDAVELRAVIKNYCDFVEKADLKEASSFIAKNYFQEKVTLKDLKKCSHYAMFDAIEYNDINAIVEDVAKSFKMHNLISNWYKEDNKKNIKKEKLKEIER